MLSFLYVYSDHSILECYNLFSGVELSMRSCFVITAKTNKMLFETLAKFYCIVHTESKLTYLSNQVGYALQLNKIRELSFFSSQGGWWKRGGSSKNN